MQHVRADLSQLDNLDIQKQGSSLSGSPGTSTLSPITEASIRAALKITPVSAGGMMQEASGLNDSPPPISIITPSSVPVGSGPTTPTNFTMGVGLSAAAF